MSRFVETADHEGDIHFQFVENGLDPYFAMDSVYKDHGDAWKTEGKPTREISYNGETWALCFDYYEGGLDPRDDDDFDLETVREYQFYFVSKDSPTFEGKRADKDERVKGGTITVKPRWPDLTSGGSPVSVPDYGKPYIDVQVQASNFPHKKYRELASVVISSFGIAGRYFDEPHENSNVNDLAHYVRLRRGDSGAIFAPDGPIARCHTLIQGDRTGYRKHEEDHTKIPGYMVKSVIEDEKASELVRGHTLGKELKHYYPQHPDEYAPDEAPHHPKFEVAFQSSKTDDTLYWSDLTDAKRELDETILNCLHWEGIDTTADATEFIDFDPFWDLGNTHEARKLVKCPLPDIEDEQEHRVMKLWGEMTDADRDVTELLLTDGGKVSPQEAAEQTNNTYRTIREVIDRMQGLIHHTYGEMELESKKIQQELLKRVRSAGDRFKQEIGSAAMDLADATDGREKSAWSKWRREYAISEDSDRKDCQKLLRSGYKPDDRAEAAAILMEGLAKLPPDELKEIGYGVHAEFKLASGGVERFKRLQRKWLQKAAE